MDGFASPAWLALLVVVASLAAAYGVMQRRRRRYLLRFANLAVLETVARRLPGRWIRHGPAALLAVALTVLIVGLAGPTARAQVPRDRATVMLVVDVSLSMGSSDIAPTRLAAAQDAAGRFVRALPPGINLGIESFAASPVVLLAPSTDRQAALTALRELRLAEATNTGAALQTALDEVTAFGAAAPGTPSGPPPARIVLESDGKQTVGPPEFPIAAHAGAVHVPVDTISFGTDNGVVTIEGETDPVPVDHGSLARVAQLSGGQSYTADSNATAHQVYDTLGHRIGYHTVDTDVSKPWLTAGTIAALVATVLALGLTQRLPT